VNYGHVRTILGVLVATTLLSSGAVLAEDTHDFKRYKIIIDRSPFGPIAGSPAATAAQPSFATRYALVGMVDSNLSEGPVQAIIEDKGGHRTYFKAEGEMIDDVKVMRIDADPPQKILLQRGLETGTLTYPERGGAGAPPPAVTPQPGPGPMAAPVPRRIPFQRGN
jgi:hypothetical protein